MTTANCQHKAVVTGGEHPNDPPLFRWINTLLGNLRTSLNGSFHAFNDRCARLRRCQVDLATGEFLQDGKLLAPPLDPPQPPQPLRLRLQSLAPDLGGAAPRDRTLLADVLIHPGVLDVPCAGTRCIPVNPHSRGRRQIHR